MLYGGPESSVHCNLRETHANRQDGGEEDNSFTDMTTHEAETTKCLQFQQSEEEKIYSSLCSKDLFFSF